MNSNQKLTTLLDYLRNGNSLETLDCSKLIYRNSPECKITKIERITNSPIPLNEFEKDLLVRVTFESNMKKNLTSNSFQYMFDVIL